MNYEVRNQLDKVPYVSGLNEEIVSAHRSGVDVVQWDGEEVTILGHSTKDGKMVMQVHITGIEDARA